MKKKGKGWRCATAAARWNSSPNHNRPGTLWRYRKHVKSKCEECGFDPVGDVSLLDVHHADHDRTNNDPSNLVTLCPNCHRKRHRDARRTRPI